MRMVQSTLSCHLNEMCRNLKSEKLSVACCIKLICSAGRILESVIMRTQNDMLLLLLLLLFGLWITTAEQIKFDIFYLNKVKIDSIIKLNFLNQRLLNVLFLLILHRQWQLQARIMGIILWSYMEMKRWTSAVQKFAFFSLHYCIFCAPSNFNCYIFIGVKRNMLFVIISFNPATNLWFGNIHLAKVHVISGPAIQITLYKGGRS